MEITRLKQNDIYWCKTIEFAKNCSWEAGLHLADCMNKGIYQGWESVFAAIDQNEIIGFCTVLKTDYYPENKYYPWISTVFVDEKYRGHRVSQKLIVKALYYAKSIGFDKAYIPTHIKGLYEKYGFSLMDQLKNYSGEMDNILVYDLSTL